MSDRSKIEWTDSTWNPIRARLKHSTIDNFGGAIGWHCVHVSEGCRNCYAEGINRRLGTGLDYKPGNQSDIEIYLDEKTLLQPLKWRKPRKIFPGSMTDLFGPWVTDEMLDRIWAVMALCPQHTFQVLTKRPERMRDYVKPHPRRRIELLARELFDPQASCGNWPLPNVWLGVSCEDQATADERIPLLLQTPAAVRFISAEPLLGPIDLSRFHIGWYRCSACGEARDPSTEEPLGTRDWCSNCEGQLDIEGHHLHWVIVGGESGPHARPMHSDWARSIRDQCQAAGASFFMKQWGEWLPNCQDNETNSYGGDRRHMWNEDRTSYRVGKKAAGRLLDGVEHNEFPGIVAITPQSEEERADV